MIIDIDEVYNMLSWDNDISIQILGIQQAKKIKSLGVFILPFLSTNSKAVWENCAKVLIDKNDEELMPYITQLFKWLQDPNWPGSVLIFNRLLDMCFDVLEFPLEICLSMAKNTNDSIWEKELIRFKKEKTKEETV